MRIVAAGFTAWLVVFGVTAKANIIDDIILHNWKDDAPVIKQNDPFFNPFGFSFPFFDVAEDTARAEDFRAKKKSRDEKIYGVKRENLERLSKRGKPWFSISEFLRMPESAHKLKTEARKSDSMLALVNDKMNQTRVSPQTKFAEVESINQREPTSTTNALSVNTDHQIVKRELNEENSRLPELIGTSEPSTQNSSISSFPRGLSDILIIFQKVNQKPKPSQITSQSMHVCDDIYCRNGMCAIKRDDSKSTEEEAKHHSLLGYYDRVSLLIIPIALGIGTVLFILELRRIFRKMKQAKISTFENQECC